MRQEAMMTEPRDVRTLWQTQPQEGEPMSIDEVRRRARALDAKIRHQDAIMTVSAVINTGAFVAVMWYLPHLRIVAAIVLATVFVIVAGYVRRRPSRRAVDYLTPAALNPCVDFYRTALVRKRDLARQLWTWFMPPAILGQAALIIGFVIAPPNVPRRMVLMALPVWILTDVIIFVFGWRNAQRVAKTMQRELDSLDSMTHTS
jgi:hypothetical protein